MLVTVAVANYKFAKRCHKRGTKKDTKSLLVQTIIREYGYVTFFITKIQPYGLNIYIAMVVSDDANYI